MIYLLKSNLNEYPADKNQDGELEDNPLPAAISIAELSFIKYVIPVSIL